MTDLSFASPGEIEVIDEAAALAWQRCPLGDGGPGSGCAAGGVSLDWQTAAELCREARARLPSVDELTAVLGDCTEGGEQAECAPCGESARCSEFFGHDDGTYWTLDVIEEPYAGFPAYSHAFVVDFGSGRLAFDRIADTVLYDVRCVRTVEQAEK